MVAADMARVTAAYTWLHRDREGELPVVLCWDVEPHARQVEQAAAGDWDTFEELLRRVGPLRDRIASLTGAPAAFTWLLRLDPQIEHAWGSPGWMAERYAGELAGLEADGDELGLHTHTWRWNADGGHWFRDHDPDWEEHCLDVGLTTFETAFGRPPRAHRAGDRILTPRLLRRLDAAGVAVDLTVEPGRAPEGALEVGEVANGLTSDFRGAPATPYRTSPDAFPAPDPVSLRDPLLVPLASGPPAEGGGRKQLDLFTIPSLFAHHLLQITRTARPPVLVFALRTDAEAVRRWDYVARDLEHLARVPGVRFVTASAAATRLTGDARPAAVRAG